MKITVKDKSGNIYTNDMDLSNDKSIIEMHFCTSYTQCVVQERVEIDGVSKFKTKDIIIPIRNNNSLEQAIDFMAVKDDELGEFVD